MAATLICGFGLQSTGEMIQVNGSATISTTVFRSGASSLRLNATGTLASVSFHIRPTGGTLVNFYQSARWYMRIDALPPSGVTTLVIGASIFSWGLTLNSSGTLTVTDSNTQTDTSTFALTADSEWHRIDVDSSGSTRTVYVDGVQWAQATGAATAAPQTQLIIGSNGSTTCDIYFADLTVFDSSIGAPASGANNKTAILIPTAGNNAGGWTNGTGGTGDIHASVANVPPVGVLASTAAAKIKNATSTTTGDYVATMQTYLAAGIPPGSIINAVQPICCHGEEVTTGNPKPGALWIASNPAQTAGTGTFDYGDNVIETTYSSDPSGWPSHVGPVSVAPSVTLGSAPTVTIRKNLASTRVTGCCFMGLYVDYTPPPIGRIVAALQAVNRASTY